MTQSDLRIGILVPRFVPFRGGIETYVSTAAAALAEAGPEVTVITQAPRSAKLPSHEMCDGYAVERHPLPVADAFDIPSPAAVRAAIRKARFDVLWMHSYHQPLAWLAAEQAATPVVFTPHYHGVGHTPLRQVLHRLYRPAGRRLMAASKRIVVDTEAEANLILRDFDNVHREQIVVIPPPVSNPTSGWVPFPGQSNVVLNVARQESYKRTDLLVRAVAQVRDRGVQARLVLVGDGAALPTYRALASELEVDDIVAFAGRVDDETLGRWWASAAMYATASEQEAYGIGLAEALLAGLPVVASEIPAHREVVGRAGRVAASRLCSMHGSDSDTVAEYADAIVELLSEPGSCSERARRCSLPTSAELVEDLLDTLAAVSEQARL